MIAASVRLEATTAVDVQDTERLTSVTFSEAGVELAVTMPRTVVVDLHAQLGQVLDGPPCSSTVGPILAAVKALQ